MSNADDWRRILVSHQYGNATVDLRKAIATMSRKLCREDNKSPESIEALIACRLIPLSKDPGVRPIGIGEVLRRIIGKAVTFTIKEDIIKSSGNLQLCGGQKSGAEIAVRATMELFEDDDSHGILLIDATNAFNSLNRSVAMQNLPILCPELAIFINNCYATPARLFISGGQEIKSAEGTTQGDPTAMAMYAISILPLLETKSKAKKIAFADDFGGVGTIESLREWWDSITELGPYIGYYPNDSKSTLVVKEMYLDQAISIFADTNIKITCNGTKHLGACIGDDVFKKKYVSQKIEEWVREIEELARIARMYPQAAYIAYTQGLQHRYTYLMRTVSNLEILMGPLEEAIRLKLLPALLNGYCCNDTERNIFSLPAKFGGLGIFKPEERCAIEYANSYKMTAEMVEKVKDQNALYNPEVRENQKKIVNEIKAKKHHNNMEKLKSIREDITDDPIRKRILEASLEAGSSNWLTTLPIKEHGFYLEKQAFWDSLYLRYNLPLRNLPAHCVCGKAFTLDHALSCAKGGFISLRHNELRDFTAKLLDECHSNVKIEPALTPLSGESFDYATTILTDEARVDIAARGVWVKGQMALFDVRVFNPIAKAYLTSDLSAAYRRNELEKKRAYGRRIRKVDQASFTPLIFSCLGGMGKESLVFYKRLAQSLADRRNQDYATTANWLRARLSFSLIRSCLLCIRGSRSVFAKNDAAEEIEIRRAVVEALPHRHR